MTTSKAPNARPPAAVTHLGEWSQDATGGPTRGVSWTSWLDGVVTLDGRQYADGRVHAYVSLWVGDGAETDAAQARELAAALLAAADELDGIATSPSPNGSRVN